MRLQKKNGASALNIIEISSNGRRQRSASEKQKLINGQRYPVRWRTMMMSPKL
jgi:hypothetical protein